MLTLLSVVGQRRSLDSTYIIMHFHTNKWKLIDYRI